MTCKWCGDVHDETALCGRGQRAMSRRSFLFLSATAAVGALIAPTLAETLQFVSPVPLTRGPGPHIGRLVAEAWNESTRYFGPALAAKVREKLDAS